jgi:hypothetical protein
MSLMEADSNAEWNFVLSNGEATKRNMHNSPNEKKIKSFGA